MRILRMIAAGVFDIAGLYVIQFGWRLLVRAYKFEDGQPDKDILGRYLLDLLKALDTRHSAMRKANGMEAAE